MRLVCIIVALGMFAIAAAIDLAWITSNHYFAFLAFGLFAVAASFLPWRD